MASELSALIEQQMRAKGYDPDDDERGGDLEEADERAPLRGSDAAHHRTLMGALRVEARVKEQSAQRNFVHCQRNICIGGGIALAVLVFIVLVFLSGKQKSSGGESTTQIWCMHAATVH
jgi:hypothetical protein